MSLIKSIASIAKPSDDSKVAEFAIYDYINAGADPSTSSNQALSLQYFPESISLERKAEYVSKKPLGGSHPLYQWLHGSERSLSVEAIFTAEVDEWKSGPTDVVSSLESVATSVGSLLKNPVTAVLSAARGGVTNYGPNHTDVPSAIQWLQSKTYPIYNGGAGKLQKANPPPKLALHIPNCGIQTYANGTILPDIFYCIMTNCSVKLTSFFKSGAPRVAEVSLSFEEIIQIGTNWGYVGRDTFIYNNTSQLAAHDHYPKLKGIDYGLGSGYNKQEKNTYRTAKDAPAGGAGGFLGNLLGAKF